MSEQPLARFLLYAPPMRCLVMGVLLLFSTAGLTRADGGLTDAVAAAFLIRTVDAELHDIAHARAAEIAAAGQIDHGGMRPGTAEVLAWNVGKADPITNAVGQWIDSPLHRGILSDGSYGRIGCAHTVADGKHWFACVLAVGPLPAQGGTAAGGPASGLLPDTQMPAEDLRDATPSRWLSLE